MFHVLWGVFAISAMSLVPAAEQAGQKQDSGPQVLNRSIKASMDTGNTAQPARPRVPDSREVPFTGRAFQLNMQTIQARGLGQTQTNQRMYLNSAPLLERK
jgi:hypothetical protein